MYNVMSDVNKGAINSIVDYLVAEGFVQERFKFSQSLFWNEDAWKFSWLDEL